MSSRGSAENSVIQQGSEETRELFQQRVFRAGERSLSFLKLHPECDYNTVFRTYLFLDLSYEERLASLFRYSKFFDHRVSQS